MTLRFTTWNVQHGSAALVQTPNNQQIAIDLGASDNFSPLQHIKRQMGISRLDKVVVTHPHLDHIEDILNFDSLSPRVFQRPTHLTKSDITAGHNTTTPEIDRIFQKYFEVDGRYNQPITQSEDPLLPANNGGVSITNFHPSRCPKTNLNNHSIVTVIEYAGVKILSPGDNESCSWEELLGQQAFRRAIGNTHVLIAAHHGRESGFHSALFDCISPLITIISDGRVVDTSATDRYSAKTRGWNATKRSTGTSAPRKCVTTRNDGTIEVAISPSSTGGIGSLDVWID